MSAPDLVCWDDLDLYGAETTDDLEQYEQDSYHCLIENRGENLADPNGGLGLEDGLGGPFDPNLKNDIETELKKDERTDTAEAQISQLTNGQFAIALVAETSDDSVVLDTQILIPTTPPATGGT